MYTYKPRSEALSPPWFTRWGPIALLVLFILLGVAALPAIVRIVGPVTKVEQSYLAPVEPIPSSELANGMTVRQSFLPSQDGLNRVAVNVADHGRINEGWLTFTLLDEEGRQVFRERLAAESLKEGPHEFVFYPQPDSAQRVYTVVLQGESPVGAAVSLWSSGSNLYPGRLQLDGQPLPGDLALAWSHQIGIPVLRSYLLRDLPQYALPLMINGALWILPGAALAAWLRRRDPTAPYRWGFFALSLVLSGSLLVLLPQVTDLFGLRLGPAAIWLLLVGSVVLLLNEWRLGGHRRLRLDTLALVYAALVVLVAASRFLALHSLSAPQFGDSLHHTLITQLLIDNGGIFENYEPYVPLRSVTYHQGFHLLAAWLAWSRLPGMDALPAATATLLMGQILNVWAIVMVGYLAEGLARRAGYGEHARWAAIIALPVAGLLSPMPAFYVNWGRYTQLAGQLFLPAALLWTLYGWAPHAARRRVLPLVLLLAAMALTHYRVVMMYVMALPALLLYLLWNHRAQGREAIRGIAGRVMASGSATALLILPWYYTLAEGLLVRLLGNIVRSPAKPAGMLTEYNSFGDITVYVPEVLLVASGVAFLWLLIRRNGAGILLGSWVLGMFVLANPYFFLRLPGTGLVNNFMIQIALYLPLGALVAIGLLDGIAWLASRTPPTLRTASRAAAPLAAGGILLLSTILAWEQVRTLVDPLRYAMLTRLDAQAAEWIIEHTEKDALFHVNGFPAFGGGVIAGADGGWWLWLTAQRATTVPPMIYGHESGFDPDYRAGINERFLRLQAAQEDPQMLADIMVEEGVDYLYIGAQQGRVGLPPGVTPLNPEELQASEAFETAYTDGFVWIFDVREEVALK